MSLLQFAVMCGCGGSMEPFENWIVKEMPETTTRMSWNCPDCSNQICIQMIDTWAEEIISPLMEREEE